jgi:hypothetical protein
MFEEASLLIDTRDALREVARGDRSKIVSL